MRIKAITTSVGAAHKDTDMKTMKTFGNSNSFLLLLLVVLSTIAQAQINSTPTAQQETELAIQLAADRPIAAGQSYWLEELTWMEIRDLIADGATK